MDDSEYTAGGWPICERCNKAHSPFRQMGPDGQLYRQCEFNENIRGWILAEREKRAHVEAEQQYAEYEQMCTDLREEFGDMEDPAVDDEDCPSAYHEGPDSNCSDEE